MPARDPVRSHHTAETAAAPIRPWLARLHPALYGMALGLLGLSSAWDRLASQGMGLAVATSAALFWGGLVMLGGLLALWALKTLRHPDVLQQEWAHPVQGATLALIPVSLLMAINLCAVRWPEQASAWQPLTLLVLAGQGVLAWKVVTGLTTGLTPPEFITPALYLPTVPGGFVGAMTLHHLGLHGWAVLLFGMGLGAWMLLEVRILNRLFAGPLPLALRPTLGIEMAPAAVGTLAVSVLWPSLAADALLVLLGLACGPVFAVLTRWRYWSETPFNMGFWSFSFPLAGLCSAVNETVLRGAWPIATALTATGVVSAVFAFLFYKSSVLTLRGQLLPMR